MIAHISKDESKREEAVSEHTAKTEYLCREKGKRCGMANMMSLCGILHDMGKNKKKFQDYIRADRIEQEKMSGRIAHASTGAKYVYDKYHSIEKQNVRILTELVSYAVAAHHGLFDCVDIEHVDKFTQRINDVEDYTEACKNAGEYLGDYKLEEIFWKASDEFEKIRSELKDSYEYIKDMLKGKQKQLSEIKSSLRQYQLFFYAALQRLMLSILIDSDWEATFDFMTDTDTLGKQVNQDRKVIFAEAERNFQVYMKEKRLTAEKDKLTDREKEINIARDFLQKECEEFAQNPAGIYCLPIPTGGGKTLSSLAYALQYCKEHSETERVFYISPYISITEQNADVFRSALKNDEWVLEHHSCVIRNEEQGEEDYQTDRSLGLDINWEEPFICTTFVQFMNALFSDRKQSLRLMHRLIHAVVIIDEIQSMPLKCVNTFNYMMNFLNVVCGTNIILCTATQPTLAETDCPVYYGRPKYMIQDVSKWFQTFRRVEICLSEQRYTFDELKDEIVEETGRYHSILIVLNTKSAVRKLYDLLETQNINVEYLTTNLCAEHRSDKIEKLKKILRQHEETIVVVSTNLIEAGVDLSFECVYRSIAGLDSLAQSAGRCNRNGEMEHGTVHLIELEGENTGNMEELMQSISVTRQTLHYFKKEGGRDDLLAPEWMDQYYKLLYTKDENNTREMNFRMNFPIRNTNVLELLTVGYKSSDKKNIMNQAYKTAGKEYRIIDDDSFGVIVPYRKGKKLIKNIQEAKDWKQIKKYIRNAQRYTVNARGNQLKKMEELGLIQSVTENIPNLYMISAPGAYHDQCGITGEWEPLIISN